MLLAAIARSKYYPPEAWLATVKRTWRACVPFSLTKLRWHVDTYRRSTRLVEKAGPFPDPYSDAEADRDCPGGRISRS